MIKKTTRRAVSKTTSLQAPTKGLNAKDPIASMEPEFALELENYFPQTDSVISRSGYVQHTEGLSDVESLLFYNSGTDKYLFGVSGGDIYDVTNEGEVDDPVVESLSNSRLQSINIGTAGGFFMLYVNGEDKLGIFDGTAWHVDGGGTYTISNVDTSDCVYINNFKNRVFLIEKESFDVWYLPVSSIAGAATNLSLGGLFKLGGHLVAMGNWTIDNASGIDDYAAFITSEGEVALYKGTDPSDADAWALVGTFRMGKPIGSRCLTKAGSDVLVLTTDGAFPLSKALLTDRSQINLAATDNIQKLIAKDVQYYKTNYGWQPIIHPSGQKLIINVPSAEGISAHQYVMNTETGAWCKFTGWNANCFEVFDDFLFFGYSGGVAKADFGSSDNGSRITGVCQQAYHYFGSRGSQKLFKAARPVINTQGIVVPSIRMNTDFNSKRVNTPPFEYGAGGAVWNEAVWDEAKWTVEDNLIQKWQSLSGLGYCGGLRFLTELKDISCEWIATDIIYEEGGTL